MSLERIFNALVSLGLSQIDSRVYVHLATSGSARAIDIINDLGINTRQIYRSLKSLQDKGIIINNHENPAEYSAFPFENVLDVLINLKEEQAQDIKKRRNELLSSWRTNAQ